MRRSIRSTVIAAPLALALALAGCSTPTADSTSSTVTSGSASSTATTADQVLAENADIRTSADVDPGDSTATISLTGDSATVDGDGVSVDGSTVTITAAGTYTVSGELTGQLVVTAGAEDDVVLILDDAQITGSTGSAILITEANAVEVQLADGSTNTLTDAAGYTNADGPTAALSADVDLIISGDGALTVTGTAEDGIASSDGLSIEGGTITVTAVDDGVRGKQSLSVSGGTLDVTSGGDGLTSNEDVDTTEGFVVLSGGTITVDSDGDAVQAETDLVVTGGTLDLSAGGGATTAVDDTVSTKGLKSGVLLVVEDGDITVDSSDDAVHTNGTATVNGGTLTLTTGDDGIHADTALDITGGSVEVVDSYEGLEATAITLSGGVIEVTASDDGVNAAGGETEDAQGDWSESTGTATLDITGGSLVVHAGGDGLDANGSLTMTGGTVVVHGPESGANGALDYDGTFEITGGTLVAVGTSGMAQSPSTGGQGWISAQVQVAAGETIQVADADGTVLATLVTEEQVSSVVVSLPGITEGEEYQVLTGGSATADATGGFSLGGDSSGSTVATTVTAGESAEGGMGG
ncbi:carbohydrate-binding domain-containing protein, partial [Cellulomonas sp. RIT-PI-Y]|uniref:carbohydrate-binding domain-containing protein n=1 Tax=Cellulomonas sp. RIT-PI-Y TaxID=3035297 RepID=UPI0021D838ED